MVKRITLKETWRDYTTYFFNPKAPISYGMYNRHKDLVLPVVAITILFLLYNLFTNNLLTDEFDKLSNAEQHQLLVADSLKINLLFLGIYIIIYLFLMPTELRMFHKRRKSPWPYIITTGLTIVGGVIYSGMAYMQNREVSFFPFLILMWVILLMSNGMYVKDIIKKSKKIPYQKS